MDIVDQLSAQYGVGGGKSRPSSGGDLVDQLSARYGLTAPAPRTRNPAAFANDTLIEGVNAAAGLVKSVSDFVSPDNPVSRGVQSFIDYGAERQSDVVKQAKRELSEALDTDEIGTQLSGVGRYIVQNPVLATAQALGSFAGPGAGIKLTQMGGRALGLGQRANAQLGLGAGSVIGGAASGGDAAGNAYDLVYNSRELAGMPEDERRALATQAAREASIAPAIYGLITGRFGAEGALARGTSRGVLRTAGSEALQEFGDEALSAYSGRKAASQYDPTINPMQGVVGQGAMGAALGGISGGVVGALTRNQPASLLPGSNPTPTPTSEPPPQQPLGLPFYPNEPMVVFPDGTTMTAAEARQRQADGFTGSPATQAPTAPVTAPVSEKTPFFEPPLVSTIPGASTLPVLGPQPQIVTGENPNAQLVLSQADPVQAFQQAYEKQQRGELLTQRDLLILNNPPQGIQLPEAAAPGMAVRQQPTQGELFDTPLRSAYDVATRGLPPVAPQGPVLNNQQAPGQAELFFPNGQPTYAASQGVPDVAGAVAETSRAAGIPASRPGSKTGTKRQQLLERIEKARMEGRFVGREAQYDDLVNDLTVNAFGRVEKGIAEIEKAPLQPAPQAGASPLAAPGARTLQEVDAEMDAMLVKGRAPQAGVAREAWNELQRERDALAARVGAPPRPKYVPPQKAAKPAKTATPNNAAKPTGAPTPVPAPAPAPPPPPVRPVAEKAPKPPKATAPTKETAQQAFDAMEDRIAYKDLTPEAKGMVDGAHKEGRLSQEEIDFIVKQDREAKNAAKRAANKPKPEDDLEDDTPPQPKKKAKLDKVPPAVLAKTEVEIDALNPDTGKFEKTKVSAEQAVESLKEDKDTFQNFVNCLKKGK